VYAALSIGLLGGVSLYVQSGLQLYRTGDAYKEAQKDAMLSLRKMTGEIANSTFADKAGGARIALPTEPDQLIVFPAADDLSTSANNQIWVHDGTSGELLWRKWVLFSLNREERLLEKRELAMKGTPRDNLAVPPLPENFAGAGQSYGRNIDEVTVSWLDPGDMLEVVLWTETPPKTGTREGTRIELRTSVRIEN
jgi:hypothetical protein